MSIVVVGSIAFDTIKTPFGQREKSLGGAANYFAMAAQFFSTVQMVGIIGEDYPKAHLDILESKNVDLRGVVKMAGPSFHWQGEYGNDFNCAKTIKTELNVFEHFLPVLPESYRSADMVFLANIDPTLQIHVLQQMKAPRIKALDTMNFWIERKPIELKTAISMIDILFINDAEIKSLTGEINVFKAARAVLKIGAKMVVIKRGEYGSMLFAENELSMIPAFPVEEVFDPTGAGDSFAGGFLGFLDQQKELSIKNFRQAMVMGTVMSSFVIEKFSFDRMLDLEQQNIAERKEKLINLSRF